MNDREWLDENVDPATGEFAILDTTTGRTVYYHMSLEVARRTLKKQYEGESSYVVAVWRGVDQPWCAVPDDWSSPVDPLVEKCAAVLDESLIDGGTWSDMARAMIPVVQAAEREAIRKILGILYYDANRRAVDEAGREGWRLALKTFLAELDKRDSDDDAQ